MLLRNRIKEMRLVKAAQLRPDARNWRTHSDDQKNALRGVLADIGIADAILARELPDGSLVIIDGHCRADVGEDTEWPVLILDVTEEEAAKLLVTLDPLAAMAGADAAKLDALLGGMSITNDALTAMLKDVASDAGCSWGQPAEIVEDEVPEPPEVAVTVPGELILLGEHRLFCGDATNPDHVKQLLDGRSPFIMVTDPPYGVDYDPRWRLESGLNKEHQTRAEGKVQNDTVVDWSPAYKNFPGRVAYVWHAGKFAGELTLSLKAAGFTVRTQIIWRKGSLVIGRGHYHWQHEPMFYAVREGGSAKWCGDRTQSTVWDIPNMHRTQGNVDDGKTEHGTQKPIECMARPIRNHGDKNDDVYDPFLGSGTTLIAAEQLGRRCYGMEIDPRYCDVIVTRWEKFTGKKAERRPPAVNESSPAPEAPGEVGTASCQIGLGG